MQYSWFHGNNLSPVVRHVWNSIKQVEWFAKDVRIGHFDEYVTANVVRDVVLVVVGDNNSIHVFYPFAIFTDCIFLVLLLQLNPLFFFIAFAHKGLGKLAHKGFMTELLQFVADFHHLFGILHASDNAYFHGHFLSRPEFILLNFIMGHWTPREYFRPERT